MHRIALLPLFGMIVSTLPAAEGMIEINQVSALAGGITTGDTAGFPVTISESGSYILTGDLTVADENTSGVLILADHVTLDLAGFAIKGPVVCTGVPNTMTTTCSATGMGSGVTGDSTSFAAENVTVRNGTVQGFGDAGVTFLFGRIEGIRAISNGGSGIEIPVGQAVNGDSAGGAVVNNWAARNGVHGISGGQGYLIRGNVSSHNLLEGIVCSDDCVVQGNTSRWNGGIGISGSTCAVENNVASSNGGAGISVVFSTVQGNTVQGNTGVGMSLGTSAYANNFINGNTGGTVVGGIETGTNVCEGTTTCP